MVPNVSLDASSLINLFLLTGNVTAVSAGGTHIVGAPIDAIGTALDIIDDCKTGNAPILSDGRTLQRLLCQANRRNGILRRAEVFVRGIFAVAMSPIETRETFLGGEIVLAATQSVKLFEFVALGFGSGQ
jgi:hypothetical protein